MQAFATSINGYYTEVCYRAGGIHSACAKRLLQRETGTFDLLMASNKQMSGGLNVWPTCIQTDDLYFDLLDGRNQPTFLGRLLSLSRLKEWRRCPLEDRSSLAEKKIKVWAMKTFLALNISCAPDQLI